MKSEEGLLRAIGPVGLALSVVNVTVGGSIFVLPAVLARDLGTAAPTAYLSGAAVMALVALAFAEAGRRTTVSGGPYAYVERAFGQFPGYLAGLLTWLATIVACGAVGAALVDSLATMWSSPPMSTAGHFDSSIGCSPSGASTSRWRPWTTPTASPQPSPRQPRSSGSKHPPTRC